MEQKNKTLEQLEGKHWPITAFESHLTKTAYELRQKTLGVFEVEDLRIMIGQHIGLPFLIPMALDVLQENFLAEGHFYPGGLLLAVLRSDPTYWKQEPSRWTQMKMLFEVNRQQLLDVDTTNSIRKNWFEAFEEFREVND